MRHRALDGTSKVFNGKEWPKARPPRSTTSEQLPTRLAVEIGTRRPLRSRPKQTATVRRQSHWRQPASAPNRYAANRSCLSHFLPGLTQSPNDNHHIGGAGSAQPGTNAFEALRIWSCLAMVSHGQNIGKHSGKLFSRKFARFKTDSSSQSP